MIDCQILNQHNNVSDDDKIGNRRENIKLYGNDNDRDGNIRDINIIFYRVWRNVVIRNEIIFHTRLFNIHLGSKIGFTMDELSTYKYKSYLDIVVIYPDAQRIKIFPPLLPIVIPYGVSEVSFNLGKPIFKDNSIPNTVTVVKFHSTRLEQEFTKGILPDSITRLDLNCRYGSSFNQSLAGGWLPNSLKSILLPSEFQHDIGVNQLPESLTELNFKSYSYYKGIIEPGSIPSIAAARPLDYTWKCECEKELTNQESSNVPISNIEYGISKCIKEGDIPHNAVSIKFSELSNVEIQGALPASLKSLSFSYFRSVSFGDNILSSSNLTSIDMGSYNLPLTRNLFPQSITSIKFNRLNQPIPEGCFYNYTHLKSLAFSLFNQIIPDKTLPPSLTSLDLGREFDRIITENTLPQSLTSLALGNNQPLNEIVLPISLLALKLGCSHYKLNVNMLPASLSTLEIISSLYELGTDQKLPSSITSLSLGTRFPIPVGSLPCNLKVLYINDSQFNQDLTEEGILPNSIQSIYFQREIDKNYINNLDVDFFKKYIRFTK